MSERLISLPEVCKATSLRRSAIYEAIANGTFPKPVKLTPSGRRVAWAESRVQKWISDMIATQDAA